MELLDFNAFGLAVVERNKLTVTLTAVLNNKSITRTVSDDVVEIDDVEDGEIALITFGAFLQNGKSRITVHEIGEYKSKQKIAEIKEVNKAIKKVVEMVKLGTGIE